VLPQLAGFQQNYNSAFQSSNVDSVVDLICPDVIYVYGPTECSNYIQQVIVNPVHLEILEARLIGTWTWEIDGLSIPVDNAYEARVNFTAQGQTSEQMIHVVRKEDGSLCFFTDCGDPLLSTQPAPQEQQASTTTLTVFNYCGTPLYLTIAGTMYAVEGNSQVTIELEPGRYPITISRPGSESHNQDLDVQPGSNGLPVACPEQPEEPRRERECPMH
jgi:hypothetical protein